MLKWNQGNSYSTSHVILALLAPIVFPLQARLAAAQSQADSLNAAIADLFRAFVARNNSTIVPLPLNEKSSSSTSPVAPRSSTMPGTGYSSRVESAWRTVAGKNSTLHPFEAPGGSAGKGGLLGIFKVSLLEHFTDQNWVAHEP